VRVVLDTNVFVSGVFFGGVPGRILEAWRDGKLMLVLSPEILDEYRRVGHRLSRQYPGVDLEPFLRLVVVHGEVIDVPELSQSVAADPDDDKFLACALAAGGALVVSGDRHLLDVTGWQGVRVLRPRQLLEELLRRS